MKEELKLPLLSDNTTICVENLKELTKKKKKQNKTGAHEQLQQGCNIQSQHYKSQSLSYMPVMNKYSLKFKIIPFTLIPPK